MVHYLGHHKMHMFVANFKYVQFEIPREYS